MQDPAANVTHLLPEQCVAVAARVLRPEAGASLRQPQTCPWVQVRAESGRAGTAPGLSQAETAGSPGRSVASGPASFAETQRLCGPLSRMELSESQSGDTGTRRGRGPVLSAFASLACGS